MAKPDGKWLDRMYNNRALVPEFAQHFSSWGERSLVARQTQTCKLNVPYGDGMQESLDIFPAAEPNAPVLVFIHGGYWRSLDKSDHSFVAPAFTQEGACVVIPNYALCPGDADHPVTIPDITMQMVKALAWTWRNIAHYGGDPSRITVVGHSAGGHLAAMLMACVWKAYAPGLPPRLLKNALSISGLFELESVRRAPFLNESLKLTPAQVRRASPAWLPRPQLSGPTTNRRGLFFTVAGGEESAEFLRHNLLIQQAWGMSVVPVCEALPGLNHFSILDALVDPGHRLNNLALDALRA